MGSPITAPVTFNGSSQFSQSLQQVITRAVSLASLPLQQLENEEATTAAKIDAVQSLQVMISGLNNSLQSLSTSSLNTTTASVSDQSVLQVTASPSALPGTYTVQVSDPGSFSSAESADGLPAVTDPSSQSISVSSSFTLTVGTNTFNIVPSGNSLNALAQAINSSGAGVQATVINIGGPTQPDYRLSLQSTGLGPGAVQLNDGTDLLTPLTTGTNALYTVNGQPNGGISSDSSTVTIAPGLTVNLEGAGTATVNVSESPKSISDALTSFVAAFNSAQAELQKSYGVNAGALSGDSSVFSASQAMSQIAGYGSGSGSIQSLSDLGIQFTQQGTMTFDATKLSSMSPSQLADTVTFLGNASTSGFLKSATDTLNGLLDSTTGVLTNEVASLTKQSTAENDKIQTQQASIAQMQSDLTTRMNAADALIASLEEQTNFLTQLFSTMNANNFAGH